MHTAGSVALDVFKGRTGNFGVFYPLMTFTAGKPVDFSFVPVALEANTKENLAKINNLASGVTGSIYHLDSEQRMFLHLAAVISSNFSNHMLVMAEKIMKEHHLNLEMLKPLLEETLEKSFVMSPHLAQTGPAVRGNKVTISKHLALLGDHPDIRELYRMISDHIGKNDARLC
jgi:predicted short-subunit dehydrogenase-like oxidoreductase (DUF2520 family)